MQPFYYLMPLANAEIKDVLDNQEEKKRERCFVIKKMKMGIFP